MNQGFEAFRKQIIHPVKFRLFMLQRLPAAFFAGLRIHRFDETQAVVTVKYKWFNQNPFRSMYFAVQSMAAEMSTGLLASAHVYQRKPAVSMLVVGLEAKFSKRVTDKVYFTCADGDAINKTIENAIATGEGKSIACRSIGTNAAGEIMSEFLITWSFKSKSSNL
ncbi:MAG: thioesterase [Bacteroidota bacterium]